MVFLSRAKSVLLTAVRDKSSIMAERDTFEVWDTELCGWSEPLGTDGHDAGGEGDVAGGAGDLAAIWAQLRVTFACSVAVVLTTSRSASFCASNVVTVVLRLSTG